MREYLSYMIIFTQGGKDYHGAFIEGDFLGYSGDVINFLDCLSETLKDKDISNVRLVKQKHTVEEVK